MSVATSSNPVPTGPARIDELKEVIQEIGLARFLGRIRSGLILEEEGFAAVEAFLREESKRPLLSKVARALFNRDDAYEKW